jgi:septum formation protein
MSSALVAPEIILASSSPRRRELLSQAGVLFKIVVSGCDETPVNGEGPQAMVERLALAKAAEVAEAHPGACVIGADTTVFIGNRILGKPESEAEAHEMLATIQGVTHEVWGGVAFVWRERREERVKSFSTRVKMAPMSIDQIRWYVSTGEPMDKAGSYAIQGLGLQFVDRVEGSYSNVVGLDIAAVTRELALLGAIPKR